MLDVRSEIARYLSAKAAAGLTPASRRAYRQRLTRFADWLDGRPLTRSHVLSYRAALQADGLADISVAGYLRDLSTFCAWLVEEDRLPSNSAARLIPKQPRLRPASYSAAQIRRLLDGADERERAIILTLLGTGLRAAELVSLRHDRIDWHTGHTTVIGKGRKERPVFLGPTALASIRAYLDTRVDSHPALWRGTRGPLTTNGVHQVIAHRAREAGIRGDVRRVLHSFRATFAKNYLKRGGDLETLRALLGHSSIHMAAYYAQLNDSELAAKKTRIDPLRAVFED